MKKDYYEILGLSDSDKKLDNDSFSKVLKKAYRKLCLKYHPDKFASKSDEEKKQAEDKFKEITEAYSVLNDAEKRKRYDMYGSVDGNGYGDYEGDSDLDEILRRYANAANPFNNPFGEGGGFRQGSTKQRGSDKRLKINITLKELYEGGTKKINFKLKQACPQCGGSGLGKYGKYNDCPFCNGTGVEIERRVMTGGYFESRHACSHCGGTGKTVVNGCSHCGGTGVVENTITMNIDIPFVTDCNKEYVKRGSGNMGQHNGISGDLYLTYNITNDVDNFYLSSDSPFDIIKHEDVKLIDCLLGCDLDIVHINGKKVKCHVNKCTPNNNFITIKGEGLPKPNGDRGDLKVVIRQQFPSELNNDEIKLLTKLKKSNNFK